MAQQQRNEAEYCLWKSKGKSQPFQTGYDCVFKKGRI